MISVDVYLLLLRLFVASALVLLLPILNVMDLIVLIIPVLARTLVVPLVLIMVIGEERVQGDM